MGPLPRLLPTALVAALLAGCAAPGPYPSLAQREVERQLAEGDEERQAIPPADDPAFEARVDALTAQGRSAWRAFESALPATADAARRSGAVGSDGWVEAQQAVSRLQTAGAGTHGALADLDRLMLEQANAGTLSPGDRSRAEAAMTELQGYADRQKAQLLSLAAMLNPG